METGVDQRLRVYPSVAESQCILAPVDNPGLAVCVYDISKCSMLFTPAGQ